MNKISISIIIPAYNEERRIGKTLENTLKYLKKKKFNYELIVVDDGSKDNTIGVVQKYKKVKLIRNIRNKGKGYSVKQGVMQANKDLILFSDADLSTPIEELDKFLPLMEHYHIVFGSRKAKGCNIIVKQPFYRRIPGKIFPLIVNIFLINGIKDTQCGFKLFHKNIAKYLFKKQRLHGFSFDAEILYLAKKFKMKIKEVPVIWINELESKLNPLVDSYKMLVELMKIKLNDLNGRYK